MKEELVRELLRLIANYERQIQHLKKIIAVVNEMSKPPLKKT